MSDARNISVRGIVVGRRAVGEGSVRVDLYTDALGLVSALAQSARMERSQLRAHLQVGTMGMFSLIQGKGTWRVMGAVATKNIHFAVASTPEAQHASARILSFIRQFIHGEGNDPYFFATLWGFFENLPYEDGSLLKDAECVAVLRMLAALGYIDNNETVSPFLPVSYETGLLQSARASRVPLLRAINGGINVSGFS